MSLFSETLQLRRKFHYNNKMLSAICLSVYNASVL